LETDRFIRNTTLLLCFTAGFCDTLTFVAAGEVFSAHVTGNFILFAYDIIKHSDTHSWQKLLTFPVFVLAVMLGGRIAQKYAYKYALLTIEGLILLIAGLASALLVKEGNEIGWQMTIVTMLIVMAMAFQNTFGKLNNKATYGLTTVMTGNVTQAALDLMNGLVNRPASAADWQSLKKQCFLIIGFLAGCIAGAVMAMQFGLVAVIIPGTILLVWLGYNKLLGPFVNPS